MASITTRKRSDGGESYQVRWVVGGGTPRPGVQWGNETFTNRNRAEAFKLDVENAGHQWPRGWAKGLGYVSDEDAEDHVTLAEVADKFFIHQKTRVTLGKLKSYTLYRYRSMYRNHIVTVLGDRPFRQFSIEDIEEWIVSQVEDGVNPKSIRNRHGLLHSIAAYGQRRMKLRPDNPCEGHQSLPELGGRAARQVRFFTHEEWVKFRSVLKSDVHLLVDVLIATGMRWGEISALRVGDITFDGNEKVEIHIQRAWSKRDRDDPTTIKGDQFETAAWKLGPPKNGHDRWISIEGPLAKDLWAAVDGRPVQEYAFQTRGGYPWRYPAFHYDRWKVAKDAAGITRINPTPHMLRHTFVVWALNAGMPIQRVSEAVGHASIQITYDVYGGLLDKTDSGIAQAMREQLELIRYLRMTSHTINEEEDLT